MRKFLTVPVFFACAVLFGAEFYPVRLASFTDGSRSADAGRIWAEFRSGAFTEENSCRISPGFTDGDLWLAVAVDGADDGNDKIMTLGPELVDRAELYCPDPLSCEGAFVRTDADGRRVPNRERKYLSWRSSLLVPAEFCGNGIFLVRIRNFDSTSLSVAVRSPESYFSETVIFSFYHIISISLLTLMFIIMMFMWLYTRDRSFLYISLMSFCSCLYQISMKGIGAVYLWNFAADTLLMSRIGYVACCFGFCVCQLLFMSLFGLDGKKSFVRPVFAVFATVSVLSLFLFGFFKDIKVPYYFSIVLLILGCLFCGILWFSSYAKSRRESVVFVLGWIPLFTYIVFRQTVHLLRMSFDMERVMALFDRDYYFSYDICFLFTILIYSVLVYMKFRSRADDAARAHETSYFLRASMHELMAPVTMLQNALEELEETGLRLKADSGVNPVEPQAKVISGNLRRIRNVAVMVNSLERQEQNVREAARRCRPVRVLDVIRRSVDIFAPYSKLRGTPVWWTCDFDDGLTLSVYPLFLETVLVNLIDNAVKYSDGGTPIKLSFSYSGGILTYKVENSSASVPAGKLGDVFKYGFRLDGNCDSAPGFGIGLHLVRRICVLYGGDCTVSSCPPAVEFIASLRLSEISCADSTAEPDSCPETASSGLSVCIGKSASSFLSGRTVLLVEDDLPLLGEMSDVFSEFMNVVTAVNGRDAVAAMENSVPDVIVSDLVMPVMGGSELLEYCRASQALRYIPFIFVTGIQDPAMRKNMICDGAVDYICKPFSADDILMKVCSVLRLCDSEHSRYSDALSEFVSTSLRGKKHLHAGDSVSSSGNSRSLMWREFGLTEREVDVAELLYCGRSNRNIAGSLGIAVSTVATHIQHIYAKCGVSGKTAWIRLVNSFSVNC